MGSGGGGVLGFSSGGGGGNLGLAATMGLAVSAVRCTPPVLKWMHYPLRYYRYMEVSARVFKESL